VFDTEAIGHPYAPPMQSTNSVDLRTMTPKPRYDLSCPKCGHVPMVEEGGNLHCPMNQPYYGCGFNLNKWAYGSGPDTLAGKDDL
jgi:hypothetical protein